MKAERDDTAPAKIAMKLERFEREAFEALEQDAFLGGGDQIVTVNESRREGAFDGEEVALREPRYLARRSHG